MRPDDHAARRRWQVVLDMLAPAVDKNPARIASTRTTPTAVGLHPDDAVGGDVCPALEGLGRRLGLRPEDTVGRDLRLARLACVGQLVDRRLLVP